MSERGADIVPLRHEELVDLFEHAPCGYIIAEPSGRMIRSNQTFAGWVGVSPERLEGRRFQDLLTIPGRIYYETHFAPLIRMQGFFNEVALDLVVRDGRKLPVLVNAVEQRDQNGGVTSLRITVFNATDRRRYEAELLEARAATQSSNSALRELNETLEDRVREAVAERMKAEEALRHSQRLEAIGQLTGGVAHDFNNLLTVILGGLESIGKQVELLPEGEPRARIKRAREMATTGAKRAASLTAKLLAFSRRQPLDPRPLDITRLITEVSEMLQRTLGEAVTLETVHAAGLWPALADASELGNALVNLAVNARDAMPEGGRLTIETSNILLDEAYVASVEEPTASGQYVLIAVSDTGHGMDKETLARVFEPFFTTKDVGKGTGLGLSQVYGFVRQTGGHVRIYSEPGEGTTVKLYLPRANSDPADEAARPVPLSRGEAGGNETILICEDEPALRAHAAEALRELGYRVMEAETGPQALALLESTPADLLFTDVVLPGGMNGRQLADAATLRFSSLKVLYTTGYTRNAIVHHRRLDPGIQLLTKPFTVAELACKIRALLDQ